MINLLVKLIHKLREQISQAREAWARKFPETFGKCRKTPRKQEDTDAEKKVRNASEIIREATKRGIKQKEIASLLGVSNSAISKWKATEGEYAQTLPTVSQLLPLAEKFELKMLLVTGEELQPTLPSKIQNVIASIILLALLTAGILAAVDMENIKVELKQKYGTSNFDEVMDITRQQVRAYKAVCEESPKNCIERDRPNK